MPPGMTLEQMLIAMGQAQPAPETELEPEVKPEPAKAARKAGKLSQ